jgi:UDP-glucuronate 4-epimerase
MGTRPRTYLITGAAGFIGSHLCRAILKKYPCSTVVGIDNINTYYNPKIKTRRIYELTRDKRFLFYKTSILDARKIRSVFASHKPSVLIHAAAQVGVRNGEINPAAYFSTNVLGTITVLEAASSYISHALIFSSSSVYGSTKRLPFRESEPITPVTPLSVYGASKAAMEIAVHNFFKRTNIPVTIVRPFSIYGPDGRPDMLPVKLLVAAKQRIPLDVFAPDKLYRDWTYIHDCVRWVIDIVKHPVGLQTINLGNGNPLRLDAILAIARKIIRPYGYSLSYTIKPANKSEMIKTQADTDKLKTVVGSTAKTSFEKGFTETVRFFLSHKYLYR